MNDRFFFEMPTLLIFKKKKEKKRKFRVGGFIEITYNFIISHLQNKTTFFTSFSTIYFYNSIHTHLAYNKKIFKKIVILVNFYTKILIGKVHSCRIIIMFLWCFFMSKTSEKNPQFNFSSQYLSSIEHNFFK